MMNEAQSTTDLAQRIAELPELPKCRCQDDFGREFYGASQMHDYALDAQAPLLERIKELEQSTMLANARADQAEGRIIELEKQNAELRNKVIEECAQIAESHSLAEQLTRLTMANPVTHSLNLCRAVANAIRQAALASSQGQQK